MGGSGGVGVDVTGGSLTNDGTIAGGTDGAGGAGSDGGASGRIGSGGIGVLLPDGGALTNAGLIRGGAGVTGIADAVYFVVEASRLILDPGASFSGAVVADAVFRNVVELASGASAGTISGFGSQYIGFTQVVVDTGARWTLTGTNSIPAGVTLTVAGAGRLTNDGTIARHRRRRRCCCPRR